VRALFASAVRCSFQGATSPCDRMPRAEDASMIRRVGCIAGSWTRGSAQRCQRAAKSRQLRRGCESNCFGVPGRALAVVASFGHLTQPRPVRSVLLTPVIRCAAPGPNTSGIDGVVGGLSSVDNECSLELFEVLDVARRTASIFRRAVRCSMRSAATERSRPSATYLYGRMLVG
jgi:hypothetical protein